MSNKKWNNNSIQFPRLLAEIMSNVDISEKDWNYLCDSMDLEQDEILEIFERAENKWQKIKQEII